MHFSRKTFRQIRQFLAPRHRPSQGVKYYFSTHQFFLGDLGKDTLDFNSKGALHAEIEEKAWSQVPKLQNRTAIFRKKPIRDRNRPNRENFKLNVSKYQRGGCK